MEPSTGAARPTAARKPVFSIDKLLVTGLDVELSDTTTTPPTVLPLNGLEAEVSRFTTRAFDEPLPIAFSAFVSAGPVQLPKRTRSSSLFGGILGAAGRLVAGETDRAELEPRPFFDEIAVNGRLTLAPQPSGWVTLDVGALELGPLAGFARAAGVEIGDGVLDQAVRLRLQGERGASVEATTTFHELRLSEPPDGPIARYLTLPAPLDTVLFLLEDAEGAHKIPVSFHVEASGIGHGEIARAAVGATAAVLARAVASSPLRMLGGVGGLFGLGGEPERLTDDAQRLGFEAGDTTLPSDVKERLTGLVDKAMPDPDRVLVLQHELGADDRARAEELANPPRADVEAFCARLRQRKAEILRLERELAAAARVHWSVGREAEARAAGAELRTLDRELAELGAALDRLGDHLRPNAGKRREARTRAAALSIARERLGRLERWLVEQGVPAARIEVRRPRFEVAAEHGAVLLVPHKRAAR